jgi:hypothetical protein
MEFNKFPVNLNSNIYTELSPFPTLRITQLYPCKEFFVLGVNTNKLSTIKTTVYNTFVYIIYNILFVIPVR